MSTESSNDSFDNERVETKTESDSNKNNNNNNNNNANSQNVYLDDQNDNNNNSSQLSNELFSNKILKQDEFQVCY